MSSTASPEIEPGQPLVSAREYVTPDARARQISLPLAEPPALPSYRCRSRKKLVAFLLLEGLALFLLAAVAMLAISAQYAEESLTALFRNGTIGLAVVVAVLPVLFYGVPRENYRNRRDR